MPSDDRVVADKGSGVAAEFTVQKGTLPRLRFGQLYRFRARIVDLAGNSLAVDDSTLGKLEQASEAVGYWRFEPIDPPTVVHRARVSEGESLERMVIRSNYDVSAKDYLATEPFNTAAGLPSSKDFAYGAVNERHFVPPKSSQLQCETHGLFDSFFGGDWQKARDGYAIAAREAGTLYDTPPGSDVQLVTPSALGEVATSTALPLALPSPDNPVGDRAVGGQYVIHGEALVKTPWLPDGAAGGVALRAAPGDALPGVTGVRAKDGSYEIQQLSSGQFVILIAHGDAWPDSSGFRLILAERAQTVTSLPCSETFADAGEPVWDEPARTLTLFVPKGRIVRLVYASFAHKDYVRSFGIPQWTPAGSQRNFVYAGALIGANWLITPFRELTLVHATQAPVCEPEFIMLTPNRQPGSQNVTIGTRRVRLHGPSTGKFEVEADWDEWVDDIAKDGPQRIHHRGQLGEIKLAENYQNEFSLALAVTQQMVDPKAQRGDVHALGDTRFRLIRYRIRATTRFREYLPPSVYAQQDAVTRLGPIATGPKMKLPPEDDPGAPVLQDEAGTDGQSLVHASAPPNDPRLLYIVPTFRWQQLGTAPGPGDVVRTGNGLRVWLDRPWFSSGDGELLGVVLFGDGARFTDIPAEFQPLVTQWGLDPFWDSPLPKTQSKISDFPARVTSESLHLQEKPGLDDPFVTIVGHRVHWDQGRGLWYCDIELDPGTTYMPFVRLALVRYQPNALFDARVSKVVLGEFAQVLPRRRATIGVQNGQVTAALRGPNPSHGPMKSPEESAYQNISFEHAPVVTGRNRVELVLQTRDPAIDSDLGWEDSTILASYVVGETPPPPPSGPKSGRGTVVGVKAVAETVKTTAKSLTARAKAAAAGRTVETRAGSKVDLASAVELTPAAGLGRTPDIFGGPIFQFDPPFWEVTAALGAAGSRPRRLMIREFERFYNDDVLTEGRSPIRYKHVIEERLVFAHVVPL